MKKTTISIFYLVFMISLLLPGSISAQPIKENPALDAKVKKFLAEHAGQWRDLNIPTSDGQLLYDLIIKGNYKSALEIGTSTGHSGIYIAWALSKTGGKLITIELDESRHKTALENFKQAGLFDFVFSDADKDWYKNYFIDLDPKLKTGGCFTSHNVYDRSAGGRGGRGGGSGQDVYLDYVKSLKNYETTVNATGGGLAISYKKSDK